MGMSRVSDPSRQITDDRPHSDLKVSARRLLVAAAVLLPLIIVYGAAFGDSGHPFGMVAFPMAMGGSIALLITSAVTIRLKRLIVPGDSLRIAGWSILGCGIGKHMLVGGYYDHFFPQHAGLVNAIAALTLASGIITIVMSRLFSPLPPKFQQGRCRVCGYAIQGSAAKCPECGQDVPEEEPLR